MKFKRKKKDNKKGSIKNKEQQKKVDKI